MALTRPEEISDRALDRTLDPAPVAFDDGGWILPKQGDRRLDSPFFNERPDGCLPELLVVHGISLPEGAYGGPHVDNLFLGRPLDSAHPELHAVSGMQVSAHFVIDRGGRLTQYVSIQSRAWHAGRSNFRGRDNCNDFSIGVELEGCDLEPYEPLQIDRLVDLAQALCVALPSMRWVAGHSDIAPGRKTDPGPYFDWTGFISRIRSKGIGLERNF